MPREHFGFAADRADAADKAAARAERIARNEALLATATTAFGFDRVAQGMHRGNVGIKTGATQRDGGKAHLADSATRRTACGVDTKNMAVSLIMPSPFDDTPEEYLMSRVLTCSKCRKVATENAG